MQKQQPVQTHIKISNSLLNTGYLYPLMQETLDMYRRSEDLTHSPVAEWGRRTVTQGKWWYGVKASDMEQGIQKRLKDITALYEAFKTYGYIGSEITIKFDADGRCIVHDGYHRLCILRYLGIITKVYCRIKHDFPLAETLQELNGGTNIYQPTEDPRTDGWHLWRLDCPNRLAHITPYLVDGSVLDCGCETGYFTRELAAHGYTVTGVDYQPKRTACARYLALKSGRACTFIEGAWQDTAKQQWYNNVLLLSVLHHQASKEGADAALKQLSCLTGRCSRLFVEFPLESEGVSWMHSSHRWSFNHQELAMYLEALTDMKTVAVLETDSPNRPIIVLEHKQ